MNKNLTSYLILLFLFISIFIHPPNFTHSSARTAYLDSNRKFDEILVKFKISDEIILIIIAQADDFDVILNYYNNLPEVEYAEPNFIYKASIIPTDTYYNKQWYLQKIKAPEAWNYIKESQNIIIAILDSGVQTDHIDLKDNIWENANEIAGNNIDDDKNGFIDDINGWDFVNNVADPSPKFKDDFSEAGILHGTIVAGIAAASGNNASGISGVTWNSRLMPIKILDDSGEGSTINVIKGIDYAILNNANIINLSFVGYGFSQGLDNAIKKAYNKGIIIVAAAGNELDRGEGYFLDTVPMYPVCNDGPNGENRVIGVAATDTLDQKAIFSSYGTKCVDISAPGLSIYSTIVFSPDHEINGNYFNKYYDGFWSGTSMATPMVSGAIALIEASNLKFNRDQVVQILLNNTDNINKLNKNYLNKLGKGRLNVYKAVFSAKNDLDRANIGLLISPMADHESIIKITDKTGEVIGQFFAYIPSFRGGVNVASGDVNGDGQDEIITGPGAGGGPHVRIFNSQGEVISQFFAYSPSFRGGADVTVGDLDGGVVNKQDEIITGPGAGGGPHVRIFNSQGEVISQFFAYSPSFRGGVNVAIGDIDKDGLGEIITGAGRGGDPHIRIFELSGSLISSFYGYEKNFNGGVNIGSIKL